jgi:sarcosine oxidase
LYSTIVHGVPVARQHPPVDVVVIGGGIVGASAALAVASRGRSCVLFERGSLARPSGSSSGTARIYAPAAYPDETYLDAGLRAVERWRQIEQSDGTELLVQTGVLSTGRFAVDQLAMLERSGVSAEAVSASYARRRFGIEFDADAAIIHQPDAGVIRADLAHSSVLDLAHAAGVEMRESEAVEGLAESESELQVSTGRTSRACSAAIIAAGPWSRALLAGAGVEVDLEVSLQTVVYLDAPRTDGPPPAIIDYDGHEPYALWDPARGLKAALHARGPTVEAERVPFDPEPAAAGRIEAWVRERFGERAGRVSATEACLYTNTPDERFILERRGRIVVGAACDGQGFQFAPETGDRLAELALEVCDSAPDAAATR